MRMKKTLYSSLLVLLFNANAILSQQLPNSKYEINTVNGKIVLTQTIMPIEQNTSTEKIYGDYVYRIIQFHEIPLQVQKNEIEKTGIILLDYVPNYAYYASIPVNYDLTKLQSYSVRALSKINNKLTLSPALYKKEYPVWAIKENNIELIISCFKNIPVAEAAKQLQNSGSKIIKIDYFINAITIETGINSIDAISSLPFVHFVEPIHPPGEPENLAGRSSHRSNAIANDFVTGRHYDGTGVKVAMFDDGTIGPHIDYQGRIGAQYTTITGGVEHGDHVSGIIMGAGNINPRARGMGFGSTLYVYNAAPTYDGFDSMYTHYNNPGIVITSTSYSDGCNAGYTSFSNKLDNMLRLKPNMIHVFSAGNNGTSNCGYGAGSGWGNITGGHKLAKNVITVANLDSIEVVNFSSSRGPASDGRLKPDVSAIGTNVFSTYPVNDYVSQTGTSMSCPGVSGVMSQLYQAYKTLNGGNNPEGGLMKAILMNGCDDLGNAGPDFIYGYGRVNALNSVKTIEAGNYTSSTITQGATNYHTLVVPAGAKQLRVMLYWTDYESSPTTGTALVNNLNMQVKDPGAVFYNPWVLDHTPNATNLNTPATRGVDNLNNAEQVTIANPVAGTYTISVNGFTIPQGPQKYFITHMIVDDAVTLTYPKGGEGLVPGEQEIIRWDAFGSPSTFTLEYSTNNGGSWNTISSSVNASARHFIWTVPSVVTGQGLVRISRGTSIDTSDANFTIAGTPSNLSVAWACPDSIKLTWNTVSGATGYEISKLGAMYMDSIGTSTTNSFIVYNTNPTTDYWFSVKALTANNGEGRRAIAINKSPGVTNCNIPYDAMVEEIQSPTNGNIPDCQSQLTTVPVSIKIKNSGVNAISNIPVNYSFNGGAVNTEIYTGTLTAGTSVVHTFTTTINIATLGNYSVKAWTSYTTDGNPYNDSLTNNPNVISGGTAVTLPHAQNFELFSVCALQNSCELDSCNLTANWKNPHYNGEDEIDWTTYQGSTWSSNTGPDFDHNPGTTAGKYLYLEASYCLSKEAHLVTPCIDLNGYASAQFSFWYHMYGADMGELHVDVLSGGKWTNDVMTTLSGNKGNSWFQSIVNLNAFTGKVINLRIRGITGNGFASDMAVDDISVTGIVGVPDENDITGNVLIYPNPGKDIFNISLLELNEPAAIKLIDIEGRIIYTGTITNTTGNTATIDLSSYSDAIYFLNITAGGKSCNKKIIKATY